MSTKKRIFLILSVLFIGLMLYFAYDFMNRTSAPWEKKKDLIRKYKVD